MKALVVYFSRTGHTRNLAHSIAGALGADVDEITERKSRLGILGYLRSGREAWLKRRADVFPSGIDPSAYDVVVVGTPIWNMSLSSPARAYLADHAKALHSVAFFCTMGGSGSARVFRQMQDACGKEPIATLARTERQLTSSDLSEAVKTFASHLRDKVDTTTPHAVHG